MNCKSFAVTKYMQFFKGDYTVAELILKGIWYQMGLSLEAKWQGFAFGHHRGKPCNFSFAAIMYTSKNLGIETVKERWLKERIVLENVLYLEWKRSLLGCYGKLQFHSAEVMT